MDEKVSPIVELARAVAKACGDTAPDAAALDLHSSFLFSAINAPASGVPEERRAIGLRSGGLFSALLLPPEISDADKADIVGLCRAAWARTGNVQPVVSRDGLYVHDVDGCVLEVVHQEPGYARKKMQSLRVVEAYRRQSADGRVEPRSASAATISSAPATQSTSSCSHSERRAKSMSNRALCHGLDSSAAASTVSGSILRPSLARATATIMAFRVTMSSFKSHPNGRFIGLLLRLKARLCGESGGEGKR